MGTDILITILAAVAVAGATVWSVETLSEQRDVRQRQLEALEQTLRQMIAQTADASAVLTPGATSPGRFDLDAYPQADARLVGDIAVLRQFYGVLAD